MKKHEIPKLQKFLRKAFGNAELLVTADAKNPDSAIVALGERRLGSIVVDDEDGDRSFSMDIKLPVERAALQPYLRPWQKGGLCRTEQWRRISGHYFSR